MALGDAQEQRFIFARVSFLLPGALGAACIRVSEPLIRTILVSIFGGVVLISAFQVVEGGPVGFFNCLVSSSLQILGGVFVLGPGHSICILSEENRSVVFGGAYPRSLRPCRGRTSLGNVLFLANSSTILPAFGELTATSIYVICSRLLAVGSRKLLNKNGHCWWRPFVCGDHVTDLLQPALRVPSVMASAIWGHFDRFRYK